MRERLKFVKGVITCLLVVLGPFVSKHAFCFALVVLR